MTTIINTPSNGNDSSGIGFIMGILAIIIILALLYVYALPAIRGQNTQKSGVDINLTLPRNDTNSPQQ